MMEEGSKPRWLGKAPKAGELGLSLSLVLCWAYRHVKMLENYFLLALASGVAFQGGEVREIALGILYNPSLERHSDSIKRLFRCCFSEIPLKRKGGRCR